MSGVDLTAMAALLKKLYPTNRVNYQFYKRFPLLGLLEKKQIQNGGDSIVVPVQISGVNNRSADYTTMAANTTASQAKAFAITTTGNYNHGTIDHKTLLATQTSAQAFISAMDITVKGIFQVLRQDIAASMYRSSTGAIGQITALDTTNSNMTFNRYSLRTIEYGQNLIGFAASNTGSNMVASNAHSNVLSVTQVDRDTGIVTFSGSTTGWASNDWVVVQGDAGNKFKGLADWLPSGSTRSTALASPFFGVVRSIDATRLGGISFDGTSYAKEAALMEARSRLYDEGVDPDICLMNTQDLGAMEQELAGRSVASNITGAEASIGYHAVKIKGMIGDVALVPDPDCPPGTCYFLSTDSWKIAHLGASLVNTWNEDGLESLRTGTNGLDIIAYSYMQPYCDNPGANAVVTLA